jgi:hypothetical protein
MAPPGEGDRTGQRGKGREVVGEILVEEGFEQGVDLHGFRTVHVDGCWGDERGHGWAREGGGGEEEGKEEGRRKWFRGHAMSSDAAFLSIS